MPITDLTGKTITFNDNLNFINLGLYYIDFIITNGENYGDDGQNYIELDTNYLYYGYLEPGTGDGDEFQNNVDVARKEQLLPSSPSNTIWNNGDDQTITITGGTDATNADLIAWLLENSDLQDEPEPSTSPVPSSFKSIAVTEHETYITLEFNGEEYDLELSTPLSSPSASKIIFGSFAQVSITDNVLSIGDKSYELVANTPTPTGYEVIFNDAMQWDDYYWSLSDASYSIDGGNTWETIPESLPITVSNVSQIMFRVTGTESGLPPRISCSDLGLDTGYTTNIETQNYPVSSNITIDFEILYDD